MPLKLSTLAQPHQTNHTRRVALLAGGDAAALLLFAAIGRANHGEGLGGVLDTALPFLLGAFLWLLLEIGDEFLSC